MRFAVFTEPHLGATYEDQLALARLTEELGFDGWFRSDHFMRGGPPGAGLPGPTDAWVTLAALARETSRIRLGTLVTAATFRHPGPLAITVAQADHMSGGRIELGLGAAWFEAEHRAYAVPFPPLGERFERLEETLEIIRGLWTTPEGETFSFEGKHHRVESSPGLPKPVQRPHPPIIIGGSGPRRTPALAARFGTEFNAPFKPPDVARAAFEAVRVACERHGRDPASLVYSVAVTTCIGADEADVQRRAAAFGASAEGVRANGLGGTPSEAVERLNAYREAGAGRVYLQLLDVRDLDHARLIAAEVLPHLS